MSQTSRLRRRYGYVPILPKPAVMPTSCQVSSSSTTATAESMSATNRVFNSSVLPQTHSTCPPTQKYGDNVVQTTLLPSTSVSSGLPVPAQNPSSASPIVSFIEAAPSIHSSGNTVAQNQSSLSAVVTQTPSTLVPHSFGTLLTRSPLNTPPLISDENISKPLLTTQDRGWLFDELDTCLEEPIHADIDEILSELKSADIFDELKTTDSPDSNDWLNNFDTMLHENSTVDTANSSDVQV